MSTFLGTLMQDSVYNRNDHSHPQGGNLDTAAATHHVDGHGAYHGMPMQSPIKIILAEDNESSTASSDVNGGFYSQCHSQSSSPCKVPSDSSSNSQPLFRIVDSFGEAVGIYDGSYHMVSPPLTPVKNNTNCSSGSTIISTDDSQNAVFAHNAEVFHFTMKEMNEDEDSHQNNSMNSSQNQITSNNNGNNENSTACSMMNQNQGQTVPDQQPHVYWQLPVLPILECNSVNSNSQDSAFPNSNASSDPPSKVVSGLVIKPEVKAKLRSKIGNEPSAQLQRLFAERLQDSPPAPPETLTLPTPIIPSVTPHIIARPKRAYRKRRIESFQGVAEVKATTTEVKFQDHKQKSNDPPNYGENLMAERLALRSMLEILKQRHSELKTRHSQLITQGCAMNLETIMKDLNLYDLQPRINNLNSLY